MTSIAAKRPMLENWTCSSNTERQKYKRRGVSVVRDFPPGCGPNAPKADLSVNEAIGTSNIAKRTEHVAGDCPEVEYKETSSAVGDFPKASKAYLSSNEAVCLSDIVKSTERVAGDCPKVENKGTSSAPESHSSVNGLDKSVDVVLEEGEIESIEEVGLDFMKDEHSFDGLMNFSKSLESTEAVCLSDIVKSTEHVAGGCPEVENNGTLSAPESHVSVNGLDESVDVVLEEGEIELMKDEHSFDGLVNFSKSLKSTDIPGELLPRSCNSLETLQMNADSVAKNLLHETEEPSKEVIEEKLESPSVLNTIRDLEIKDVNQIFVSEEKRVVEGDLPHYAIPSTVVFKERKYPPRRSVSAKRDFPPACGLSSKNCLQGGAHLECKDVNQIRIESGANKAGMRTNVRGIRSCIDDDVALGNDMSEVQGGRSMHHIKAQSLKNSDGQSSMSELQRNKCVQSEKLKLEHYRKVEKGAYKGRESEGAIVYRKGKGDEKRRIICPDLPAENVMFSSHEEGRVSVQDPMTAVKGQESGKATSSVGAKYSGQEKPTNAMKLKFKFHLHGAMKDTEKRKDESIKKVSPSGKLLGRVEKTMAEDDRRHKHLLLVAQSRKVDVSLHPSGTSCSVDGGARNKVRETLRLFHALTRKLLHGKEINQQGQRRLVRVDLQALSIFTDKGKYIKKQRPIVGPVPGVEVGDEFQYRVELMLVGLHRPPQAGIDTVKVGERVIATSIVESGGYDNNVDDNDVWIYTGEGGNVTGKNKEPEDQKLERGNLALKNSIDRKNVIRVIRGVKDTNPSTTTGAPKISTIYTYYGLYTVERYWPETGKRGKKEFKFELKRVPGQPELAWKEVKKSKKFKTREGRCVADISEGKEQFPICAVNTIDGEKPPPFTYITRMMYPGCRKPLPSRGCDCKNGCLNSNQCSCVVRNGGEIPYNFDGAIVKAKPLVYECGPSCKCPPSCYNRVSQHGIGFELEIFKTESRGWGVRSMNSIPSGSFICEYTGKLLEDKEAEQRTGNDEYLFDIGRNYNDHSLWEGLRDLIPDAELRSEEVVENAGFTIDAAQYGNVGRFINHSCSPNLYAQDVLYDHGDTRMPHVMFFAAENIRPLQELTYHYNYAIGQVYDKDGNEKVKHCYCGSSDCTGRMY